MRAAGLSCQECRLWSESNLTLSLGHSILLNLSWTDSSTCLCLSFPICKMGMTVVPTGLNWCEDSSKQCKGRNLFSTDMYLAGHIQLMSHKVLAIIVVQSLSCVWFFATPRTAVSQASLSFTVSWSLLKLMSIESVMPSNHLILCHPFLLLFSMSIFIIDVITINICIAV